MKVKELFNSYQGEGLNAGRSSVFLRLSGCNMACSFCDTDHANGTETNYAAIVAEVERLAIVGNANLLVVTGGEPMLQAHDLGELCDFLDEIPVDLALETNGSINSRVYSRFSHVSLSPKGAEIADAAMRFAREVKIVVTPKTDIDAELRRVKVYGSLKAIFLQPESNSPAMIARITRFIAGANRHLRPLLRLGYQLHKYWQVA